MGLSIAQSSSFRGGGRWDWTVQLDGTDEELDRVEAVEYTLHPTFFPPSHRITDRSTAFQLNASGWGEFMIHAAVEKRDGSQAMLRHWLQLEQPPTPEPPTAPRTVQSAGTPAKGEERLGEQAPARVTSVFLSSGVADLSMADKIREVLEREDSLDVSSSHDIQFTPSDEPVERRIRSEMRRAGSAVFLVSDRESPWLGAELKYAREAGIPTAIVRTGTAPRLPSDFQPDLLVDLATDSEAESVGLAVAEWANQLGAQQPDVADSVLHLEGTAEG